MGGEGDGTAFGRWAAAGRGRSEGRAKEERRQGERRGKCREWCGDGNGGGLWLNGKKCVFLQNNTDG